MSRKKDRPSLPEVHRSIKIPNGKGFWRKLLAYAGPGYLVSVGYIDPGNWATDIAGGAKFGYTLDLSIKDKKLTVKAFYQLSLG